MALPESWDEVAKVLGYQTEAEMLRELYEYQQLSISQIVKKLGYAQNSVRARLKEHGIHIRGRGGPNSLGKTLLKTLTNKELLLLKPIDALKYNCNPNTIYKEKRRRGLICTSLASAPQLILNNILLEETSNSVLPKSPYEILDISSGTESEENKETSLSLITELTKES